MYLGITLITTTILRPQFFKNIEIIMLGNWQGINQIGLGAALEDYKAKKLFTNMNILPTTLR